VKGRRREEWDDGMGWGNGKWEMGRRGVRLEREREREIGNGERVSEGLRDCGQKKERAEKKKGEGEGEGEKNTWAKKIRE
jgi:hypothetical protein